MTIELTRPAPAAVPGPLDDTLYDLVEARFRRLVHDNPAVATFVGIHAEDHRLADGSRDAVLGELAAERAHLAAIEALDPAGLSAEAAFERELELHNVRQAIFRTDAIRTWERRSTALDGLGDALFLVFARDFAPLQERLEALAGRLEGVPTFLAEHRTRATVPQVRLWQQVELATARSLPGFIDEIEAADRGLLGDVAARRLRRSAERARSAIAEHATWVESTLATGTDDWALGGGLLDELIRLRAFDGLDTDAILAIGLEQLAEQKAARVAAAREIDPDADEPTVVDRIKRDHPATFDEALDAYRDAMRRARAHLIERDLVTVPDDERLEVVPTPGYLRTVIPFAAYFEPPKFDRDPIGIYIVTPSVDGDPNAMREHNRSSISNTSIHEAYPGHHLQLSVSTRHPSLTRLLADAPEFTEGWGMYSEQLMREEGFDDDARFRLAMHTDAIWRACRIVLDIRLHRGEIGVDEAVDFLVGQTGFERANARAEVRRYTYTPTYQLSYLLGKVLILGLRDEERRRLGDRFRLRDFHDTLLRNGSIPISFHRRVLRDGPGAGGAPRSVGPASAPGEAA
ncbi:MAG TPA: DUF885 domain-containing protein [Candidatus Limnocylindrales bacterium]|nr:DUF885 domain-containing protein [Candidatus Limnocylindrales bacterium]